MSDDPFAMLGQPSEPDIPNTSFEDTARFAVRQPETGREWTEDELRDSLLQQLSSPIEGLESLLPNTGARAASMGEAMTPPIKTIGAALLHEGAPMELLVLIKQYGKLADSSPSRPILNRSSSNLARFDSASWSLPLSMVPVVVFSKARQRFLR